MIKLNYLFLLAYISFLPFSPASAQAESDLDNCIAELSPKILESWARPICKEADAFGVAGKLNEIWTKFTANSVSEPIEREYWLVLVAQLFQSAKDAEPEFFRAFNEAQSILSRSKKYFSPSYAFYRGLHTDPRFHSPLAKACRAQISKRHHLDVFESELTPKEYIKSIHNISSPGDTDLLLQICIEAKNERQVRCAKEAYRKLAPPWRSTLSPSGYSEVRKCLLTI